MLKTIFDENSYAYCTRHGVREHPELINLRNETAKLPNCEMQITPDQGALMGMLARLIDAQSYLEIGVFTGYSTLWMALNLAENAKITALDVSSGYLGIANKYWQAAGIRHKIDFIEAPANNSLKLLIDQHINFDIAFIDANKSEYIDYYEYCLKLVRPGGLIMIDNILMHGEVLNKNTSINYIKTLQKLNILIKDDPRVDICIVPIGDGMTLARKKDN